MDDYLFKYICKIDDTRRVKENFPTYKYLHDTFCSIIFLNPLDSSINLKKLMEEVTIKKQKEGSTYFNKKLNLVILEIKSLLLISDLYIKSVKLFLPKENVVGSKGIEAFMKINEIFNECLSFLPKIMLKMKETSSYIDIHAQLIILYTSFDIKLSIITEQIKEKLGLEIDNSINNRTELKNLFDKEINALEDLNLPKIKLILKLLRFDFEKIISSKNIQYNFSTEKYKSNQDLMDIVELHSDFDYDIFDFNVILKNKVKLEKIIKITNNQK